ncbi:MAG: hypothetical protein EPO09_17460 [Aquabacterium sp.]|uniref:hypothetical protein n=1 Tax=Aquabacterium sp. TaxID=1872578 RepID=UPI00122BFED5|nr:hypothetical protein [Aquabacterium sp.]TAK89418.1 MAG: hypothetical protein EPO09_17460 [Aquabacterium sp.]
MRLPLLPAWPLALAIATTALLSPSAWAHGGEDHGDEPAAINTPATLAAPRATAQTDSFELVAVMQAGAKPTLTLYLDHADTNAPIEGASIEVESGAFKGTAKAVEPGVYTLPAPALASPGRYPLTITVQSAAGADLMDATLDVGASDAPHEQAQTHASDHSGPQAPQASSRWPWLAAAAGLLIALGITWRRLRPASTSVSKESA